MSPLSSPIPTAVSQCPGLGVLPLQPPFLSAMLGLWLLYPFLTPRQAAPSLCEEVM